MFENLTLIDYQSLKLARIIQSWIIFAFILFPVFLIIIFLTFDLFIILDLEILFAFLAIIVLFFVIILLHGRIFLITVLLALTLKIGALVLFAHSLPNLKI
jgi:hypothetical protein